MLKNGKRPKKKDEVGEVRLEEGEHRESQAHPKGNKYPVGGEGNREFSKRH